MWWLLRRIFLLGLGLPYDRLRSREAVVLCAFAWESVVSVLCLVAPFPGVAARCARVAGASFACCRPSRRSYSGWVLVCFFSGSAEARAFAGVVARSLRPEFFSRGEVCVMVRPVGRWFAVSVPVLPGGSWLASDWCPCVWVRF
jgi:hypothetical protein